MNILFITWDGPGPNYHESLFLPIFAQLQKRGYQFHLLQYSWSADERTDSIRRAAARLSIPFAARSAWRSPAVPATTAMVLRGAGDIIRYARDNRIDVLMPRSIIPAGMALVARRFLPGVKLLYDADGLMADERADFAGWSRSGLPYRALRAIESAAVKRADRVLTRTRRSVEILANRAELRDEHKFSVVLNGRDPHLFRTGSGVDRGATRVELDLPAEVPLIVYAGSLGVHYHPDRMVRFASCVQRLRPEAHMLILSGTPEIASRAARSAGLDDSCHSVRRVAPDEVARLLSSADLGLAFRTPSLSQQAVSPIKVGEYLLCGVPILGSAGIGDLDDFLDSEVGRLIPDLDDQSLESAARWFVDVVLPHRDDFRSRCRELGVHLFSLGQAVSSYRDAFHGLSSEGRPPTRSPAPALHGPAESST